MVVRGRYFGFFIDGENRGQVQEWDAPVVRTARLAEAVYAEWTESDAEVAFPDFIQQTWHHQRMVVVNRLYGVWTKHSMPQQEDMDNAVLTLIDMDPLQARLCEIDRR